MCSLFAFGMPGHFEMLIILGIALLLFGNRLPSLARSFGKSIVEFKKGVHGIEEEVDDAVKTVDKSAQPKNGA
ncbi:MAG: twin-arginine translocase TatA/TatE family subunit [Pirellulaceae bacterium]|nr:twin-arginine translocase TatA/TatE family subunit [Pirellulaceae bacterium]